MELLDYQAVVISACISGKHNNNKINLQPVKKVLHNFHQEKK